MNRYWILGPITNYSTNEKGFHGEVRVVEAAEFDRFAHANRVQAEVIQELRAQIASISGALAAICNEQDRHEGHAQPNTYDKARAVLANLRIAGSE